MNRVYSEVTQKWYNPDPEYVVRITNFKQYTLYMKHGVYPLDIYPSKDRENDRDILVMVFDRKESLPLYIKWQNHELV